ncbi:maleylacetate reductase [Paraburkholderia ginsengiterrae]|uniref:Maleylacetate reductase n=1 Tax=Paraburkholderia ginsengiterrae TaxID=1462993 RepID=A0A1A9MY87_9BURK|nr:maleylacetate reductase [Paraburkholderia ginsengiterrae]OAJ52487.1 maleylacetate reductase [Paraburkholderia ginsengiterrae]OAJ52638.1 maleylacetate reductase [Paraburkholderia ginsengiterrae]
MFQRSFIFSPILSRVVFGRGALSNLLAEFSQLGVGRALVVCTPEQVDLARAIAGKLGSGCSGVFPKAAMHVPIEVAREARLLAASLGADCIVAVGGGSTIGLGKAIALESSIPILAIPTTYAGSEMTPIYGITEGGAKKTGNDIRVLPRTVIYDPELTLSLPVRMSATSGMNAIAHCVEALYAANANPVTSMIAEEGIRYLARGLPRVVQNSTDIDAREECLYGAWLAGTVLGTTSVALHHKLCHTLGGMLNLPHAETHTIVLPHVAAYNAWAAPDAMASICRALGAEDAAQGLFDLAAQLGIPQSLRELGVNQFDLDRVTDAALTKPYPNPRPLNREAIRALLENAYWGHRPELV